MKEYLGDILKVSIVWPLALTESMSHRELDLKKVMFSFGM